MSCPWVENCGKKYDEKTAKYGLLWWESRKKYPGYNIDQCYVAIDVVEGWLKETWADYEKARWCKGKGYFAKNAEGHNLVLAQHSTYFRGNDYFLFNWMWQMCMK